MHRTFSRKKHPNLRLELPPLGWTKWGPRMKAAVVIAVQDGTLQRRDAFYLYMLSEEELSSWEEAFASGGIPGLYGKRLPSSFKNTS